MTNQIITWAKRAELATLLADRLEDVQKAHEKFSLSSWGAPVLSEEHETPHMCGTSCCAMGYAALIPEFQEVGLGMVVSVPDYEEDTPLSNPDSGPTRSVPKTVEQYNEVMRSAFAKVKKAYPTNAAPDDVSVQMTFGPKGEMELGWCAVDKVWGVRSSVTQNLFSDDYYGSDDDIREVIRRLRIFASTLASVDAGESADKVTDLFNANMRESRKRAED